MSGDRFFVRSTANREFWEIILFLSDVRWKYFASDMIIQHLPCLSDVPYWLCERPTAFDNLYLLSICSCSLNEIALELKKLLIEKRLVITNYFINIKRQGSRSSIYALIMNSVGVNGSPWRIPLVDLKKTHIFPIDNNREPEFNINLQIISIHYSPKSKPLKTIVKTRHETRSFTSPYQVSRLHCHSLPFHSR